MGYATTYEPEMRKTEHGRKLYHYWKKARNDMDAPEFETFPGFMEWAMANGYTIGAKLVRRCPFEPYSPDNCFWISKEETETEEETERIVENEPKRYRDLSQERKWDNAVNRIRRYYGMEPIHSSAEINTEGYLFTLSCQVGDNVFAIRRYSHGAKVICNGVVTEMYFTEGMRLYIVVKNVCRGVWGKDVFPSRDEAEAYLGGDVNA